MRVRAAALALSVTAAATSLALLAPAVVPADAAAGGPAYRRHDYADGRARYVLPPGENGLVNATDALAFETTKQRPANSQDQLGQYAGLLYGYPHLTNATLGRYFNDESFGVRPKDITRTETPENGVTIYRDQHDVPHIYGDTDRAAAFGAGYAQAEDRLFLMDVLRHYGAGTLSGFLGASCEFEQMDHDQLLLAPYTRAQAQRQV
ncbi:MAG TPA: penicillin acylase family protein, partial [Nocardioides sp.]|nr:penicillin acylase family protein [Nocardioides sp.]